MRLRTFRLRDQLVTMLVGLVIFGIAIAWHNASAQPVNPNAPIVGTTQGTTSCATGAGTTCNVAVSMNTNFGSTTGFTCNEDLYGGTPASGPTINDWNTSASGFTIYLTGGVTSTTYTIVWSCRNT